MLDQAAFPAPRYWRRWTASPAPRYWRRWRSCSLAVNGVPEIRWDLAEGAEGRGVELDLALTLLAQLQALEVRRTAEPELGPGSADADGSDADSKTLKWTTWSIAANVGATKPCCAMNALTVASGDCIETNCARCPLTYPVAAAEASLIPKKMRCPLGSKWHGLVAFVQDHHHLAPAIAVHHVSSHKCGLTPGRR